MNTYFCYCKFNLNAEKVMAELLDEHLKFIAKHTHHIIYGGLTVVEQKKRGICYFIHADSIEDAQHFISQDPYHLIYNCEIKQFIQRIPKI